jgi:hypothetical protein
MPVNKINSLVEISTGITLCKRVEKPNIMFIHDLKKNVGPSKYKKKIRNIAAAGNKSMKNEKNRNSDTKKSEPGNPRKISKFVNEARNNLGHR